MEYCYLGNSGLQVSRIGLGTASFGTALDEQACQRIVDAYCDAGGNLLDTANLYGGGTIGHNSAMAGTSERTVGKVVRGRRDQLVIATKGYWLMEDDVRPNSVGLSRTYLTTQIEASLRRLGTDYIDLYQCHSWDYYTPIEETLRSLDDCVRAGKIRYIGASNFDGWHVVKANACAEARGVVPLISNQIWYNLADRGAENSLIPACRDQNVAIIVWGPLAEGFLTGRYQRGAQGPANSRILAAKDSEMFGWGSLATERNWTTLDVLARLAGQHGRTIPNVATRWLLQAGTCAAVLVGASQLEHFLSNLEVLSFRLSEDEMQELTEVSEPPPSYPRQFHDLFCRQESKWYGGLR